MLSGGAQYREGDFIRRNYGKQLYWLLLVTYFWNLIVLFKVGRKNFVRIYFHDFLVFFFFAIVSETIISKI